jgi:hypothetical protein
MDNLLFGSTGDLYGEEDEPGETPLRRSRKQDTIHAITNSGITRKISPGPSQNIIDERDISSSVPLSEVSSVIFESEISGDSHHNSIIGIVNIPPLFFYEAFPTSSSLATAIPTGEVSAFRATVFAVGGTKTVTVPCFSSFTSTFTQTTSPTEISITDAKSLGSKYGAVHVTSHRAVDQEAVGFTGIFFRCALIMIIWSLSTDYHVICSTFFGGSTPDWASPRDQHALFRDFRLEINA